MLKKFFHWLSNGSSVKGKEIVPVPNELQREKLNQEALEKYQHLYEYSTGVLKEEHERFYRADEKASKLLTSSFFLIGANGFFCNWIFEKILPSPLSKLTWWIVALGAVSLGVSFAAFVMCNFVIRTRGFLGQGLRQKVIDFYDQQSLLNIYASFSRKNLEAFEKTVEQTIAKYRTLNTIFGILVFDSVLVMILAFLYGWHCL